MARKNAILSVETTGEVAQADSLRLTFTVEGNKPLVLNISELPTELLNRAILHGLTQKVADAAALPKNEDGSAASPADKYNAIAAVISRLTDGEWNKRGEGNGESAPSGLIRRAFVEYAVANKKSEASANAYYDKLDRKAQLALRNVPEVSAIMERIKSERGATAKPIDADALLAGLD